MYRGRCGKEFFGTICPCGGWDAFATNVNCMAHGVEFKPIERDLRDWFAGMAIQGMLIYGEQYDKTIETIDGDRIACRRDTISELASEAYRYADAMLAARAKKEES